MTAMWGDRRSRVELAALAAGLGADVPFFVHGGTRSSQASASACNGDAAAPLARTCNAGRARADGCDLREPAFDTVCCVSENKRLFRELRPQRSRADCSLAAPRRGAGDHVARAHRSGRADERFRCFGLRRVRKRACGAACGRRASGDDRRTCSRGARAASARGVRAPARARVDRAATRNGRANGQPRHRAIRPREGKVSAGESPSGKAPDFDSGIRRFDPYLPSHSIAGRCIPQRPSSKRPRPSPPWPSSECASSPATRTPSSRRPFAVT